MRDDESCARCGESQIMHITIKDTEGEIHYICRTVEYKEIDRTRFMTRKEREAYDKTRS